MDDAPEALIPIEQAIDKYVKSFRRNAAITATLRDRDRDDLAASEAIWRQTEKSYADLLDARDLLWDGERIPAVELHTFAVLKALGLRQKECRAVWLYYHLGSIRPRSRSVVAEELGVQERVSTSSSRGLSQRFRK